MQALDPHRDRLLRRHVDHDLALPDDRALVLADLVALGQVRVEIVLAVEGALQVDLGLEPEPGADRLAHALLVDDREHAGHRRIDKRNMAVRLSAEFGGRTGKQLRLARDLGMDLYADNDLPIAGRTADE